ncbi:uncharacterized protein LOC103477759 [Poecilia reticulata]|uniref:uncharacterized protein LOC103477759 n=1 Tax=Poecilia reticulata TaxID=8081 RepID=UPI0007E9E74C|nr:PREDICTED: uncharacterized protein LOC103477759 [Poecilia reticulata]
METMELLVETLQQLSLEDFAEFRTLAEAEPSLVTSSSLEAANVQDVVDLMVKSSSGECVEAVRTVLMKMDRLDLVQRLSAADSGAKDKLSVGEERLSLDQRVEKLSSDLILMLETLKDLSDDELQEFKRHLNQQKLEENEDWQETADLVDVVIFIMQTYGKESLMVTRDVLENIRRKDLVQKLSSSSASRDEAATPQYLAWLMLTEFFHSDVWEMVRDVQTDMNDLDRWLTENGFKSQDKSSVGGKPSLDQMMEKQSSDFHLMLETLKDLSDDEQETFKRLMSPFYNKMFCENPYYSTVFSGNILETADLEDTVIFIMQTWGKYSLMVVRRVLKRFRRKDLVQKLSSSSASRGGDHGSC